MCLDRLPRGLVLHSTVVGLSVFGNDDDEFITRLKQLCNSRACVLQTTSSRRNLKIIQNQTLRHRSTVVDSASAASII